MGRRHWLRPEREPTEGGMVTFRRQLLLFLALLTFQSIWLLVVWMVDPPGPTLSRVSTIVGGICLAVATYILRRGWPRLTSWLYVCASLALVVLIYVTLRRPVSLALFTLPVLLAGVLLGRKAGLLSGIATALILVLLNPGASEPNTTMFWIVLIGATCGIGIVAGHALEQVDYWERALVTQQRESILQLRERQGELNRTLKALDEAYVSLKRSNDELQVARQEAVEARALKEQFVANVSHELRTPLNIIFGFAEMMYLSPESYAGVNWTPALQGDVQEVYRASRHLQSLVNDILDLSRIDASRLPMFREIEDIRTIIAVAAKTIAPLLQQRGLSYREACPEELPHLFVDRTRIRQVMLNLLNNAVRFTDKGSITVAVEKAQDAVVVSVQDTGVGIPEEQLESIFEEFRQVDGGPRGRGGAGLGLALSRQFVKLHGGRMWAQSKPGVGSVFSFSLPLPGARPQTTPLRLIPDRRHADLSNAPLVVVDPDPSIADMLGRYLGDRTTLSARDLHEAALLVESEHPLSVIINVPPHVALEDWFEPLGGPIERYSVPVFRCSIPSPSWLRRSTGLDDCLTKPISREILGQALQKHCAQPNSVLVVDDDPGFVRLMTRMLEALGCVGEIRSAYNGSHALRLAREIVPDLVFLDLLMPEMDGFQVLRTLHRDPALCDIPVVAVTATSYAETVLRRRGSRFTLTQAAGLSTGTLTELLNGALRCVRPDYVAVVKSLSSA